jgi:hypothetical protein
MEDSFPVLLANHKKISKTRIKEQNNLTFTTLFEYVVHILAV